MKLFNKGKARIIYADPKTDEKGNVLRDKDGNALLHPDKSIDPEKTVAVHKDTGERLLRLYPNVLVDIDKVTLDDVRGPQPVPAANTLGTEVSSEQPGDQAPASGSDEAADKVSGRGRRG